MLIFVGDADVTGLPAIRTIIQPIHAETNIVLRLTEATIFLADTLRLGFVALRAKYDHVRNLPVERTNSVYAILGQVEACDKHDWVCRVVFSLVVPAPVCSFCGKLPEFA